MLYRSIIEQRGMVPFPEYAGERVYMLPVDPKIGLPQHLSRWQPTLDAMLDGIDVPNEVYLMIDQSPVTAGLTQRRPGLHIDGYWNPDVKAHGGGGHRSYPLTHRPVPARHAPEPTHGPRQGRHGHTAGTGGWACAAFDALEAVILASDVTAAQALAGVYAGPIGEGGDCSHLGTTGLSAVPLSAGYAYAGNVTCLHESLPVGADCVRTLVRLNVPGWSPR